MFIVLNDFVTELLQMTVLAVFSSQSYLNTLLVHKNKGDILSMTKLAKKQIVYFH